MSEWRNFLLFFSTLFSDFQDRIKRNEELLRATGAMIEDKSTVSKKEQLNVLRKETIQYRGGGMLGRERIAPKRNAFASVIRLSGKLRRATL